MRVAGIMSGTSLDGIDVAIVDIAGGGWKKKISVIAHSTTPYPAALRKALLSVSNRETHTASIARLHFLLGELYATALAAACRKNRVRLSSVQLIGCHGQTIFHEGLPVPFLGRRVASTLQIGDGSVVAQRVGIPVVSDFRTRDMAAGGQGAPLVPYVDYLLYRERRLGRIALNIGGIANLTAIPPGGGPEDVIACDTGPGNMVIDALVSHFTSDRCKFDRHGRMAASGVAHHHVLKWLLRDPFFHRAPPKTAGREQFGREFVEQLLALGLAPEDLVATATAFTAAAVSYTIGRFVEPRMRIDELIVSGGGARNPQLMACLAAFLPGLRIRTSEEFGIDADAKEAIAFAILAYETWQGRPSNLPSATGARRAVVLGKISL